MAEYKYSKAEIASLLKNIEPPICDCKYCVKIRIENGEFAYKGPARARTVTGHWIQRIDHQGNLRWRKQK